jgi:hypothetical protein
MNNLITTSNTVNTGAFGQTSSASVNLGHTTIKESDFIRLLEVAEFIEHVVRMHPEMAELWSAYQAKKRILR